jgi:flagellar biosynthetic protein FliQ
MTPEAVVDISRNAVQTILLVSAPMMMSGLIVGLIIGIFQAATQINEQTMTFAPKIVAVMVALILAAPWIINLVVTYTENLYKSIGTF